MSGPTGGARTFREMQEFAKFGGAAQRYIRRSLDVAFDRRAALDHWSQEPITARAIEKQRHAYAGLADVRATIPVALSLPVSDFVGRLILISCFDLAQGQLPHFTAYRFLYERLLGAAIRPWLPAAFCGASSLPHIHPSQRSVLLRSISEAATTAPGWSAQEPLFFPAWLMEPEISAF